MTDLSLTARALIDAARIELTPTGADLERGRARLVASIAPAGGAVLPIVGLITIVAIVAGLALVRRGPAQTAMAIAPPAPAPLRAELPRPVVEPGLFIETVEPPTPAPAARIAARPKRRDAAPSVTAPPVEDDDLAREVALLRVARAALRRGDRDGALATLAQYHRDFPVGQLGAEAAALAADAREVTR